MHIPTRQLKKLIAIPLLVIGVLGLNGCYEVTKTTYDPGKTLQVDWYAAIPVESGHVTACTEVYSDSFSGAGWQCRSVHGVEGAGDPGNWAVDTNGDVNSPDILARRGTYGSSAGYMLVMANGEIFEGCVWHLNTAWACDYKSSYWSAPFKTTQGYNYLRATVDWGRYVTDALGCAGGLAGTLWGGSRWTIPLLADCSSGPL